MATFGEVSWNDDFGGSDKNKNKDVWLKLEEGSNELRLITQPHQYLVHRYKKDESNKKDFGTKVKCSAINGSCPLCAMGDKAKPRWLLGVIDRKSKAYRVLDVSYAVFSQIRKLARNTQRWGDPTKYDIDIVVDKEAGPTGYYSVQPISKEPLSAEDHIIKDRDCDLDFLKKQVTPPTAEEVQKRLDKINGVDAAPVQASQPQKAVKQAAKPAPVSMDDDDMDADFPSV